VPVQKKREEMSYLFSNTEEGKHEILLQKLNLN